MTTTSSGALSMLDIATEMGQSLPLSANSSMVLGLGGKSSLPISFSDLYGKNGNLNTTKFGNPGAAGNDARIAINVDLKDFMGGQPQFLYCSGTATGRVKLQFQSAGGASPPTTYRGNILVKNNRTGVQAVMGYNASASVAGIVKWTSTTGNGYPANLIIVGTVDSFTIIPTLSGISP